ncbi:helix-turn-helix domain-containing protein [Nonomuraea rhizosphaerae]|uniref:helix-turn-helix domain-containing protein n=1 Tax=Nonomuraea rhizosphaerae TaxID=2665663 RepID=UPI001C5F2347|nr:helix-turn-helix transcriptional regulator [Nonomuraea rhizosphaerae]
MTDERRTSLGPVGESLRQNIKRIRESQRLTYTELSKKLTTAGRPIAILGLRRIERGQRRVDVDDLVALAAAFGITPSDLLSEASACGRCFGRPPEGFACRVCGAGG